MLKCHNDGKEKKESFEVWDDDDLLENIPTGYGATKEEALDNYLKGVEEYKKNLLKHCRSLRKIKDMEITMVDFNGIPL